MKTSKSPFKLLDLPLSVDPLITPVHEWLAIDPLEIPKLDLMKSKGRTPSLHDRRSKLLNAAEKDIYKKALESQKALYSWLEECCRKQGSKKLRVTISCEQAAEGDFSMTVMPMEGAATWIPLWVQHGPKLEIKCTGYKYITEDMSQSQRATLGAHFDAFKARMIQYFCDNTLRSLMKNSRLAVKVSSFPVYVVAEEGTKDSKGGVLEGWTEIRTTRKLALQNLEAVRSAAYVEIKRQTNIFRGKHPEIWSKTVTREQEPFQMLRMLHAQYGPQATMAKVIRALVVFPIKIGLPVAESRQFALVTEHLNTLKKQYDALDALKQEALTIA